MLFCLDCKRFLSGDSLFCPGCGGAVGGVRCKNGHTIKAAKSADYCSICRNRQFVQAAPILYLGCFGRLAAWIIALLCVKALLANIDIIIHLAWNTFLWIVGCKIICWFFALLELLIALKMLVWLVSLGSKELAAHIDPFPKLVPAVFRLAGKLLLWCLKALLLAVEGRASSPKSTKKKRTEAEEKS